MGLCLKPRDLARLRQDSLGPAEADQVIGLAESRLKVGDRVASPHGSTLRFGIGQSIAYTRDRCRNDVC